MGCSGGDDDQGIECMYMCVAVVFWYQCQWVRSCALWVFIFFCCCCGCCLCYPLSLLLLFSSLSSFTAPTGSYYFGHMPGGYFPSAVVLGGESTYAHIHPSTHALIPYPPLSPFFMYHLPLPRTILYVTSHRHRSYICGFWNVLFLLLCCICLTDSHSTCPLV
ncbi:hypothetical protein P691DRAFT_422835 [Macrolepiota fuliginosa MF-IS2]|uniref:Uncharacterized protein n=1 Tax=Macrolepiota fuliginosa MF-IS2 TaxID=1400762 RepID=A0A9P5XHM2_9AGAR|nr:hypothetical protein P691DRAFT_422835 [Macrolepiota fuliginosa MF-IS2]